MAVKTYEPRETYFPQDKNTDTEIARLQKLYPHIEVGKFTVEHAILDEDEIERYQFHWVGTRPHKKILSALGINIYKNNAEYSIDYRMLSDGEINVVDKVLSKIMNDREMLQIDNNMLTDLTHGELELIGLNPDYNRVYTVASVTFCIIRGIELKSSHTYVKPENRKD